MDQKRDDFVDKELSKAWGRMDRQRTDLASVSERVERRKEEISQVVGQVRAPTVS